MINVTQTFLPPFEEYISILERAWEKRWLTNNGDLVKELEQKLKEFLEVKNFYFATNGTIVLQMALKVLELAPGAEIITTPYSYVATTNSILWEGFTPVFVDINANDFNIDAALIEAAINEKTGAILATHVFGNPCDIAAITAIAQKHNLKVIYDGAHAFGTTYNGRPLLSYGDIATCSFHATKVFHTVEGGCIIAADDAIAKKLFLMRQFGHLYDDYSSVGINGKNSEFHGAMGLSNFPYIGSIIQKRKEVAGWYDTLLSKEIKRPVPLPGTVQNYAYYPIVLETEEQLLQVTKNLNEKNIFPRRYFYPSLNTLPFLKTTQPCPQSENISKRSLSLPLSTEIERNDIELICSCINGIV
jgi:dTDP-4-amino-4,6-dideoxygalactose transaminase